MKTKNKLLHYGLSLLTAGAALFSAIAPAQAADKKPNIVHIVADDLGWKDVGFNGCTDIKTPNIDALAAGGAKFTQFYVQPMCTPTRAAPDDRPLSLPLRPANDRHPFRLRLRPGHHRMAHAAVPQGGRLQDRDHRQVASRPRRQEVLAEAARLRLPVRRDDRRAGLLHARASMACSTGSATTSRSRRKATRPSSSARTRSNTSTSRTPPRRSISISPSTPRTRRIRRRRNTSTAISNIADPTRRTYAGMVACLDDEIGRVVAALDKKRIARQHAHPLPQRQRRHDATRCSPASWPTCRRSSSPATTARIATAKARSSKAATRVCALRQLARPHQGPDRGRPHSRRGHLSDARRAGRRVHRQVQAARRRQRLGHHRGGQALAAHRDRLQRRAVPRRDAAGRLETHLAHPASLER